MKKIREFILFLILVAFAFSYALAQSPSIHIQPIPNTIHIDGKLDETFWANATPASDFWMNYPFDTLPASTKTEVKVFYDEQNLYIGAICHNSRDVKKYVIQSLKRDFSFNDNEAFSIFINAFTDVNTGFSFGVNPYGSQRDGIVSNGGLKGITESWDGMWEAEVFRSSKYWSVEMAIPIKTLRFKEDIKNWRINFARNDQTNNEISTWIPVERGFKISSLMNTGRLIWDETPRAGTNVVLIPYAAGISSRDYENNENNIKPSVGLDAKVALNSSLYLDVTANPNFSQVEVDQQVINLDRFELFFPEKRIFFLENSDMFSSLGNSRIQPFFSRRIGGADNIPIPIHFGARVSGKLNKDWRLGMMTVQTDLADDTLKGSNNYSVVTLQRSLLAGSTLTGFLANRQQLNALNSNNDFNFVSGLEFDYRSKDTKWTGEAFVHFAQTNERLRDAMTYSLKGRYRTTKASIRLAIDAVGENYITDMGYVPHLYHENETTDSTFRIGYIEWRTTAYYRFYLKNNNVIDYVGPEFSFNIFTNNKFDYQEHNGKFKFKAQFMNSSNFSVSYINNSPVLYFPFTLSGLDVPFPIGNYKEQSIAFNYDSGKRKDIFGTAQVRFGNRFMGKGFNFEGQLNYRMGPRLVLGSTFSQQYLYSFPENYGNAKFTLVGSKFEISFNRNLFLTTYLQYNTQANNINVNSRFQWRFRPMSDLYLVYTENYFQDLGGIKNRALVLKMNYWWGF